MYREHDTFYNLEHTISFGDLNASGNSFVPIANTWTTWHLIPSSRPAVVEPKVTTNLVEIPGRDDPLDLTDYLLGRPIYGIRSGNFTFYIDNNHENWDTIKNKITSALHGKRLKMRLEDSPEYYYEGRFTVSNYASGASFSSITINYQLNPYKIKIVPNTSTITVSGQTKTSVLSANEYPFAPIAERLSGTPTVSFGGVSKTLSSGTVILGSATPNANNNLVVSGTGSVKVTWRGGTI
jgi:hypothetical protein